MNLTHKGGCRRTQALRHMLCFALMFQSCPAAVASRSPEFRHDVDVGEESGERFQLHSRGQLVDPVNLDQLGQVKRVACSGNRLLLALTDATIAHEWKPDRLVAGGPKWGCNASHSQQTGLRFFVKIVKVEFVPEDKEVSGMDMVTIYHTQAGPLDMLREASIFFHYEPGKSGQHYGQKSPESKGRFRRDLYNIVSNVLNHIDWQANFTTAIPFAVNQGSDHVAFHKPWGQDGLTVTAGPGATGVTDDFTLRLENVTGEHRVAFTFDLVIKNSNGTPQIVRYISQFEVDTDMAADATVAFAREMGVTYNTTVRKFPLGTLLRVPVAHPAGLPPVELVVTGQSLIDATVRAYSAGPSTLRTSYAANGLSTLSQQYDPVRQKGSDVSARGWSVHSGNTQHLSSSHRTEIDFSVFQTLQFNCSISWHYHDVDLDLSPPASLTLRPAVRVRSSRQDMSRCITSHLDLDLHAATAQSRLTVTAFGLQLWDVPLQPSMSKDLHLIDARLGQVCVARCEGESTVNNSHLMTSASGAVITRNDPSFLSLRTMNGHVVQFTDSALGATWCGNPGTPCYSCTAHALDTPTAITCAARLMTPRLVAALTHLSRLVDAEWPQKQLLVLEAWDEDSSNHHAGIHSAGSAYKTGRAAQVGLTSRVSYTSPSPVSLALDTQDVRRLGQLAVCAGLEHVQPVSGQASLEVAVGEDGDHVTEERLGAEEAETRDRFWQLLDSMDVQDLYPLCTTAPYMPSGSSWPDFAARPEAVCGTTYRPLHRVDRDSMDTLVEYPYDDASLTFEPEGDTDTWCGEPTRPCADNCDSQSGSLESWDWCSTRMMTPRAAMGLRKLQKLLEMEGLNITVVSAFSEKSQNMSSTTAIFNEGRALMLASNPRGNESVVASLAVCAGFDYVRHTDNGHVEVHVITHFGYRAQSVEYSEGSTHVIVPGGQLEDNEYTVPGEQGNDDQENDEGGLPALVDGGYLRDTPLSEDVLVRDVVPADSRFFRLDDLLLLCIEFVKEDFPHDVEIVNGSGFRTRSNNFLHNVDARHTEERWRFQMGQAVELRPLPVSSPPTLLLLAKSILRECPVLTQERLKGFGLGCHADRIYLDIRPLQTGREAEYVSVWDGKAEGTAYCDEVADLQTSMILGGPVIHGDRSETCRDRGLDSGLEFLSFQMGQTDLCSKAGQTEFCSLSLADRQLAAERLQSVLTAAAGHGRLPGHEIIGDIRACLVDSCGGCMGGGPQFDEKIRHCSRVVHKYVERAATPYPNLTDVVTFFNTGTATSTVHGEACKSGSVCVEETIIYSILLNTVTSRFYPVSGSSAEREMFDAVANPTPLLDIAAQELAFLAKGKVTVFIERDDDINALRSVLKVLFAYNPYVDVIDFQIAPGVNEDMITSSIQRKVTYWAGATCPEHGRFTMTPFLVTMMDERRHRRSAELSEDRNRVKADLYDWETHWLSKMF